MNELYKALINPRGKYGYWGIAAMIMLGIALMVVPGLFLDSDQPARPPAEINEKAGTGNYSLAQLEAVIAQQVSSILSQVEGAGKVAVSISLDAGPEQSYAHNTAVITSTVEEKDNKGGVRLTTETNNKTEMVLAQGKGEPLLLKEMGPRIKGVLVVAEGAKDAELKGRLSRAVQAMLDLPAHRVMVLPKKAGE